MENIKEHYIKQLQGNIRENTMQGRGERRANAQVQNTAILGTLQNNNDDSHSIDVFTTLEGPPSLRESLRMEVV